MTVDLWLTYSFLARNGNREVKQITKGRGGGKSSFAHPLVGLKTSPLGRKPLSVQGVQKNLLRKRKSLPGLGMGTRRIANNQKEVLFFCFFL